MRRNDPFFNIVTTCILSGTTLDQIAGRGNNTVNLYLQTHIRGVFYTAGNVAHYVFRHFEFQSLILDCTNAIVYVTFYDIVLRHTCLPIVNIFFSKNDSRLGT